MRQKTLRSMAIISVAVLTLFGCLMRAYQLHTIFDPSGLPEIGNPVNWLLTTFTVLVTLACLLLALSLTRHSIERGLFEPDPIALGVGMLAGLVLAVGAMVSLFRLMQSEGFRAQALLELLQLLAAFCVLTASWLRWKGAQPQPVLHALICLWQVMTLLLNFKNWSMDPTILDYCFRLFALICGMCATYHLGTFAFEKGGRRRTAFWCLAGCYFSLISAIGESFSWKTMAIGLALWQLANVWQLFRELDSAAGQEASEA